MMNTMVSGSNTGVFDNHFLRSHISKRSHKNFLLLSSTRKETMKHPSESRDNLVYVAQQLGLSIFVSVSNQTCYVLWESKKPKMISIKQDMVAVLGS